MRSRQFWLQPHCIKRNQWVSVCRIMSKILEKTRMPCYNNPTVMNFVEVLCGFTPKNSSNLPHKLNPKGAQGIHYLGPLFCISVAFSSISRWFPPKIPLKSSRFSLWYYGCRWAGFEVEKGQDSGEDNIPCECPKKIGTIVRLFRPLQLNSKNFPSSSFRATWDFFMHWSWIRSIGFLLKRESVESQAF